ncbi:hypothetical protein SLNWT_4363 [Streptomyces albus]|uniref:Uncharacterized protein n=1 Tax=Streptomyces albus (strain ATCC 21838 / DSM 41398 / FERM P-419 / JCM 4703 / NBRC 107858) TaxID=1081613 RepID=A0A0B5ESQ7_STRA4|nr:hypothetical protein SLNWT_4363 [Streptomyces albus]AOU79044.1 hypothetical protein SLNHY_4353 [Streptomyces albus]AYN34779.1 hypothetical protein DUI70_4280 [Streptomyces albus]
MTCLTPTLASVLARVLAPVRPGPDPARPGPSAPAHRPPHPVPPRIPDRRKPTIGGTQRAPRPRSETG